MFQSNKIHNNVLHLNFAPNYNSDVENNNDIENTNHSFQFWGNSTLDLKIEHLLAYNNNYVSESFSISEWNLYGSSRLGARNIDKVADVVFLASRNYNWVNSTVTNEYVAPAQSFTYKKYRLLGAKTFELTNHLGNVITTISDRKLMVEDAQNLGFVHHYKPEILSIGEQYAFGMSMPGRTFSVEKYRYGMNTQEKDDDIFEGAFTAEYWEYDSRVGRRWNLDPVSQVSVSDYACFYNNPIVFVDILGDKAGPIKNFFKGINNILHGKRWSAIHGGRLIKVGKGNWFRNFGSAIANGFSSFGSSIKNALNSAGNAIASTFQGPTWTPNTFGTYTIPFFWEIGVPRIIFPAGVGPLVQNFNNVIGNYLTGTGTNLNTGVRNRDGGNVANRMRQLANPPASMNILNMSAPVNTINYNFRTPGTNRNYGFNYLAGLNSPFQDNTQVDIGLNVASNTSITITKTALSPNSVDLCQFASVHGQIVVNFQRMRKTYPWWMFWKW
jgi:hypothetical protein